ncbi:hypothetical protein N0Q90_21700 (plasmid) [Sinorhizobium sp. M103]|uniref:hypothetical protein n=1 Tax=Sinorhizobium sp. M103 TaxID=2976821 RepID=UPI0023D8ABB8|nr:hypothetical protein [Sinorhizobium sp. M103]WEJ11745.1 hypothetical protein N0Q90_21700 [Sinorhizobium sp. M103]
MFISDDRVMDGSSIRRPELGVYDPAHAIIFHLDLRTRRDSLRNPSLLVPYSMYRHFLNGLAGEQASAQFVFRPRVCRRVADGRALRLPSQRRPALHGSRRRTPTFQDVRYTDCRSLYAELLRA